MTGQVTLEDCALRYGQMRTRFGVEVNAAEKELPGARWTAMAGWRWLEDLGVTVDQTRL